MDGGMMTCKMVNFMQTLENYIQEDGHHETEVIFYE